MGVPVCRFEFGLYLFFLFWPWCPGYTILLLEGGREVFSFVFVASLLVCLQFGRWLFSTGSLLLFLSAVCLAFGSLSFVLREGGHRGIGGMFGWKEREEGGGVGCAFLHSNVVVGLPSLDSGIPINS